MDGVMASPTGANEAGSSGDAVSFQLQSRDLPSRRLLGKGLCGIVYETVWNGGRYARKDFVEVPREIFLQEAKRLSRLEGHKNIVKTYGYTVDDRSSSLVLEYMDNDLLSFLQKRKDFKRKERAQYSAVPNILTYPPPLELREALDIMLQIATGMAYLHGEKIVHGDLKPRNVLLTHLEEGGKSVKVADFGLVLTKSKSMFFASRRARLFDMAQWKSPEHLKMCDLEKKSLESDSDEDEDMTASGDGEFLFRADVYSFAVTSFQILTGEVPFPCWNWKGLLESKFRSEGLRLTLPAMFNSKLLTDLLESCWGDAAQRPDFSTLCEELIKLVNPANIGKPFVFQTISKCVAPVVQRKQSVPKPAIEMPRRKRRKVDVAASSSSQLVLDSRLQDPVIREYPASSLSEIERTIEPDFQTSQPAMQRKSMEPKDSSSIKPVEIPRSPDSVLDDSGFLSEEDDRARSFLERLDNQVRKQRELDDAAAPESWAPPEFVTYTPSPIRKRLSRALKTCVIVSAEAVKRPSPDARSPEGPRHHDDHLIFHGRNHDPPPPVTYHNLGVPFYLPQYDMYGPGPETPTSKTRWKKAFIRIPSKIVNSIQLCKPKSIQRNWKDRTVNCVQFCLLSKSNDEEYTYPGPPEYTYSKPEISSFPG